MTKKTSNLKIGYIVKMFPRISETFILNEILELERRGAEVVIFSIKKPNEGKFHPQLTKLKARVIYLEDLEPKRWAAWLGDVWPNLSSHKENLWRHLDEALLGKDSQRVELLLLSARVGAIANELNLSHLHAHFASLPSTVAYFAHLVTGIPFSFTAHAKDIFVYDMEEHLLREKLSSVKFMVTVTKYNYNYLMKQIPELPPETIKVIYNGVETEKLKPDTNQSRETDLILGVGRLVPKKGFNTLIEACKLLKDRGVPFRCFIAGEGLETETLYQMRQNLDLADEITFMGAKRQNEIVELMHQATILCLPCTVDADGNQDALPTVILEAMACGLPVISTNLSGIPEMIDSGINGLLVEPNNPTALSNQLERLLTSKDMQIKFTDGGYRKVVEKFDIKKNVGSLLELFNNDGEIRDITHLIAKPDTN